MRLKLKAFLENKRQTKAASLVEYGLISGLISVMAISSTYAVGQKVDLGFRIGGNHLLEVQGTATDYVVNGSFETGGSPAPAGWTVISGPPVERNSTGYMGLPAAHGYYTVDTNASPGHLDMQQTIAGLTPGQVYRLSIYAGDRDASLDGEVEVYWGGNLIGTISLDIEDTMQEFSYIIESASGDGSDSLRIIDTGDNDNVGLNIDYIRILGR